MGIGISLLVVTRTGHQTFEGSNPTSDEFLFSGFHIEEHPRGGFNLLLSWTIPAMTELEKGIAYVGQVYSSRAED